MCLPWRFRICQVIDACAEMLVSKQNVLSAGVVFAEKSYFFSSIYLGMVNNVNKTTRDRYLEANMRASVGCRFWHFPICHKSHWTLVVYDTEVGSWKHYNSIRPRPGSEDTHYNEALLLKGNVVNFVREKQLSSSGADVVLAQDRDCLLEVVTDSPQQRLDSPDCAIIVCYVMRQYVHHNGIKKTMEGTNCVKARATMVEAFVDVPTRGLQNVANAECGGIHHLVFCFWFICLCFFFFFFFCSVLLGNLCFAWNSL
ncbi:hypothetical protein CsSME_00023725 [Camellia sinensis var. sinensis]